MAESRRSSGLFLIAAIVLLLAHVALWLYFPTRWVELDALDEMMVVERPVLTSIPKHPLAEPMIWFVLRGLHAIGYTGNAIRPTQVASGIFMTATLAMLGALVRKRGGSDAAALGLPLMLGATYVALHLSVDPYVFYWPPSLACATAAVLTIATSRRRSAIASATVLSTLAVLFNPMVIFVLVPLAVWIALGTSEPAAARPARIAPGQAMLFLFIPAALLALALWLGRVDYALPGPWGSFFPGTLRYAAVGIRRLFFPPQELVPPFLSFVEPLQIVVVVLLAWWLAVTLWNVVRAPRTATSIAWGLSFAASAVFVAWWDPNQHMFWILPLWIGLLALAGRAASGGLALMAGLGLLVANLSSYAIPTATRDDPARAAALAIAAAFPEADLLVYPVYQELRVEYWAHRQTTGWVPLKVYASPGESVFGHLARRLAEQRAAGGRTWMLVSPDGSPPLDPFLFERAGMDFEPSDVNRIHWGERREVAGRIFREVIAIDPD